MKVCKTCGERYPDDANFCPMDASKLEPLAAAPAAGAPAATGAIGGRFTLGERLGGASTGEVYAAVDGQTGAQVVVKLCHPAVFPSAIAMERTQRELRQLQRTQHQALAAVVDHGKLPDGRLYVAMERCDGRPLSAVIGAEGPMPFARVRAIVCAVGDALVEAQRGGVIHRDVAPKNVLLGPGDRVKLINFGVAPKVNDRVFGVPEFLSPEQAEGKPADQRSNIYSLGALAYFLMTGRPVHYGPAEAVLAAHQASPIQPLGQLRPDLAGEVERVVTRALERNASRRQLTLKQFLTELETISAQPGAGGQAPQVLDTTQRDLNPPAMGSMATLPASAASRAGLAPAPVAQPPMQAFPQGVAPTAAPPVAPAPAAYAPTAPPPAPGQPLPPTVGVQMPVMPAPVAPAPAAPAPATASPPSGGAPGKAAGFRETLWFKKGEVEEYLKQGAAAGQPVEAPVEDSRPIEDRYTDDGSVTAADRAKFSLRTGGTQVMGAVQVNKPAAVVPGERVSDAELFEEYAGKKGSGAKAALIIAAIVLLIGLVAGLTIYFNRNKDESKDKKQPAAEVTDRPFRGGDAWYHPSFRA
jgi:eukaryotic-like serine/threonine-protein kinase